MALIEFFIAASDLKAVNKKKGDDSSVIENTTENGKN
jgi:hypothetical protein